MKSIELHTAVADNGGSRRDAGETVAVGNGDRHIGAARAADLVERQQAVAVELPKQQGGDSADEAKGGK